MLGYFEYTPPARVQTTMNLTSPKIEATAYQLACARNIPGIAVYLCCLGKRLCVQEARFQPGQTAKIQILTGSYDESGNISNAKIRNYPGGEILTFQVEGYGTSEETLAQIRIDAMRSALPAVRAVQSAAV